MPSLALMETAGRACAEALLEFLPQARQLGVVVFAGPGNNGGDGWVLARLLHRSGLRVQVLSAPGPRSPDCEVMAQAALGVGVAQVERVEAPFVGVDALLGTGQRSAPSGGVLDLIAVLARAQGVLAVDMPTGVSGDTGELLGEHVVPELTVTFGAARAGQLLRPERVGHLVVADIGLLGGGSAACAFDGPAVAQLLPAFAADVHKGRRGHLGVFAGSEGMEGAASLVCLGALRAGCGLVTLHSDIVPRGLPVEVMHRRQDADHDLDLDAGAVGPGLGQSPQALRLWRRLQVPSVFDADGLNGLGPRPQPSSFPRVITPHPGEAARLLGITVAAVERDRLAALSSLHRIAPALLKGRNTLISGAQPRFNLTGGPMLATAGSGDVLTGIVGAFLARGLEATDALTAAAFVHGLAGEIAGDGCLASDIADAVPAAIARLPERTDVLDWRPLCA